MKIRSAKDVIDLARARGFIVLLNPGPPPMPVLRRPSNVSASEVTEVLLGALKAWRVEIIAELQQQDMEWKERGAQERDEP
jgi:hypothetical protein